MVWSIVPVITGYRWDHAIVCELYETFGGEHLRQVLETTPPMCSVPRDMPS
ncbi:hypothetical protein MGG_11147 [Pyricularia oryzae 70-15]|uniref:Uncharacterized protein n=4 Tax=Pyricularia oryzae TaxID=318829 RepID=G4MVD1_PYRO7|nr:uncharacterized protein MGG_11147 [Pyricularia oryzae 70-15]ELQ41179.1 hypothetical protein OOU_Y34scaffold00295g18 [Pyricularia oryzae Y34]KAI7918899.1 hypothetical protein M0657_007373 [Pyricularia oryzae]EHA54953.1 hypothetical protein MGG_11147 [Pyricularia oryzae 70-15]KAI7920999.1 hypothetical protein M9X92_005609 [Pyricularia oryzae]QBZ56601.1 hypothetical protein PoMZ_01511 [Pyricularia oryzae]